MIINYRTLLAEVYVGVSPLSLHYYQRHDAEHEAWQVARGVSKFMDGYEKGKNR